MFDSRSGRRVRRFARLLPILLFTLASVTPVAAQTFEVGDLYLSTRQLPTVQQGIMKIDPLTGANTLLVDLPEDPIVQPTLTWDPFRNRLLTVTDDPSGGIMSIDPSGNVAFPVLAELTPALVAARGTGIVYLWRDANEPLRYLDASDVPHDLLDVPGTAAYTLALFPDEMIYDPGTNSLLLFQRTLGVTPPSVCPDHSQTCAVKIPLTPAGIQVAGAVTVVQTDVSMLTMEAPVGSGYAPSDDILLVVDTNGNAQEPRMQRLDPSSMVFTTWASNGAYTGAAATNAGTYSSSRGQAVILDTLANRLRGFNLAETGSGALFGSGLSVSGSGEDARLVEIHTAALTQGLPQGIPALGIPGLVLLAVALVGAQRLASRRPPISRDATV